MGFLLATDLAVLDHADGSILLIANAINYDASDEHVDEAWRDAVRAARPHAGRPVAGRARSPVATYDAAAEIAVHASTPKEDYLAQVEVAKEYIRSGDAFQVVLSQRFSVPVRRRRLRRLPDPSCHQSEPVHVPDPGAGGRSRATG